MPALFDLSYSHTENTTAGGSSTAITPPASMVSGQQVVVFGMKRSDTVTLSVLNAGGQTWTSYTNLQGGAIAGRAFSCVFNGTWSANPEFENTPTAAGGITIVMLVYDPSTPGDSWNVAEVSPDAFLAPTTPFDVTWAGTTLADDDTLVLVAFMSQDDNSWAIQTANWTNPGGFTTWRNLAGSDNSISIAHRVYATAGSTGSLVNRQTANGGDAGIIYPLTVRSFSAGGGGASVTPGLGAIILTAFAPVVTATAHVVVTVGAAALSLSAFAPTITATQNVTVTPGVGSVTLTGFNPTVTVGNAQEVEPGLAVLSLTGFAPTVTGIAHVTVTPGVGSLTLTGLAPTVTVSAHIAVTPGVGSLSLTGFAPTVSATAHQTVTPGVGSIQLTGFAPTATGAQGLTVTPGTASVLILRSAPTVTVTAHVTVTPGVASISMTGFAPTVIEGANVEAAPGVALVTLTGFAPSVSVSDHQEVTPGAGALTLTGFAPTVTTSANVLVTPGTGSIILTGLAPTITSGFAALVTPGTAAIVLTGYPPTVFAPSPLFIVTDLTGHRHSTTNLTGGLHTGVLTARRHGVSIAGSIAPPAEPETLTGPEVSSVTVTPFFAESGETVTVQVVAATEPGESITTFEILDPELSGATITPTVDPNIFEVTIP